MAGERIGSGKACSSSLKSTNSPEVAAVANLAGMVGMELLYGAI